MLDKLRDSMGKLDKKALVMAVGVMLLSWTALPIVYFLIVRKKKPLEESKKEEVADNVE
jgi:hypothetical protein